MTEHWIWLSRRKGLGPKGQRALLERFGSPEAVYAASEAELCRAGLSSARRQALLDRDLGRARVILERCQAAGLRVLTLKDPAWPARLRLLDDAPVLLYVKGKLPPEDRPIIALVGAREADGVALALARRLGRELGCCGGRVVTGMAKGIDAQGALGALEGGAQVIGVLGCGSDRIYPRENAALFARVAEQGCLLSEYPPGTAPNARNFPVRNRLISALSDGVTVVRAAEHSGSLITAQWALEQGREVFAVPGDPADPLSRGCNALLRDGAQAAESGWDILRQYEFRYPGVVRFAEPERLPVMEAPSPQAAPSAPRTVPALEVLSPVQRSILELLEDGPLQLDALIFRLGLPAGEVLTQLTLLQVKQYITQKPGKIYQR